eukprot:scaffold40014_cov199-Amphora_coffeaeformis.AAC.1
MLLGGCLRGRQPAESGCTGQTLVRKANLEFLVDGQISRRQVNFQGVSNVGVGRRNLESSFCVVGPTWGQVFCFVDFDCIPHVEKDGLNAGLQDSERMRHGSRRGTIFKVDSKVKRNVSWLELVHVGVTAWILGATGRALGGLNAILRREGKEAPDERRDDLRSLHGAMVWYE